MVTGEGVFPGDALPVSPDEDFLDGDLVGGLGHPAEEILKHAGVALDGPN